MENQIFEWVKRYSSGTLTSEEGKKLRIWIEKTSENQKLFEQYLRSIKTHRVVFGMQKLNQIDSWKTLQGKLQRNKRRSFIRRGMAIAASLVLLLGVGIMFLLQQEIVGEQEKLIQIFPGTTKATLVLANGAQVNLMDESLKEVKEQGIWIANDTLKGLQYQRMDAMTDDSLYHTIKVPVGGEYHFTLSDGTKVWLNSDSELRFPIHFTKEKREIYLKGEIYVEVVADAHSPFIVHTQEVAVEVLGTKFNVAAYTDETRVVTTLLEGAVHVAYGEEEQLLSPEEQAIAHLKDSTLKTERVDASVVISWIKGVFEYENMTLEQIAAQLERWYDVKFVFSAPEFKERRFTGVVKKYEVLNDVLKLIEKTTNVCFSMSGRVIAVQEAS